MSKTLGSISTSEHLDLHHTRSAQLVNEAIVTAGMAWHYVKYSDDQKLAEAEIHRRLVRLREACGRDPESHNRRWQIGREAQQRREGKGERDCPFRSIAHLVSDRFDYRGQLVATQSSGTKAAMSYWLHDQKISKRHNSELSLA